MRRSDAVLNYQALKAIQAGHKRLWVTAREAHELKREALKHRPLDPHDGPCYYMGLKVAVLHG